MDFHHPSMLCLDDYGNSIPVAINGTGSTLAIGFNVIRAELTRQGLRPAQYGWEYGVVVTGDDGQPVRFAKVDYPEDESKKQKASG